MDLDRVNCPFCQWYRWKENSKVKHIEWDTEVALITLSRHLVLQHPEETKQMVDHVAAESRS
jgi:hypothetical protein